MTTTKTIHTDAIARLNSPVFPDGTYNIDTMEAVEFSTGYQVTFCQEGDNYDPEDYEFLVSIFCELSSDGIVYAGKFGGTPEISFHFSDLNSAIRLAKKFNQVSIWSWKIMDGIITGGTGKRENA